MYTSALPNWPLWVVSWAVSRPQKSTCSTPKTWTPSLAMFTATSTSIRSTATNRLRTLSKTRLLCKLPCPDVRPLGAQQTKRPRNFRGLFVSTSDKPFKLLPLKSQAVDRPWPPGLPTTLPAQLRDHGRHQSPDSAGVLAGPAPDRPPAPARKTPAFPAQTGQSGLAARHAPSPPPPGHPG